MEVICNALLHTEISYSDIDSGPESRATKVLKSTTHILKQFHKADILQLVISSVYTNYFCLFLKFTLYVFQLTHTDFFLYMKLSHLFEKFKFAVMSEVLLYESCSDEVQYLFNPELEQRVCDTYKSRIEHLKSVCNEKELQKINEEFVSKQFQYICVRTMKEIKCLFFTMKSNNA